jgi:FkbM family methyltransferase
VARPAPGAAGSNIQIIDTASRTLATVALLARYVPPGLSGVFLRLYTTARAAREKPGFIRRSSVADFHLRSDRTDWVANAFAVRGFYDLGNVVIANAVCARGDTIVEVGANIGTESLAFSRVVGPSGRVVCFEPFPANVELLRAQLALNEIENVTLHPAAAHNRTGVLRFLAPHDDMNFGEGRVAESETPDEAAIEVPCVALDDLYLAGQFGAPRLLAIDVQGDEPFVLRGAERLLAEARPFVVVEVEQRLLAQHDLSGADLHDFLRRRGYAIWRVNKWGLKPANAATDDGVNWCCVPDGESAGGVAAARRISARLCRAALLPLIRGLNPAVVS